jgi:type IV pilus assembly protein PilO
MASLPRIVTLHDFKVSVDTKTPSMLEMSLLAKTYRYRESGDDT